MGTRIPLSIVPIIEETVASDQAGTQPSAQLTYRGGPLLTAVEVVTVFWGSAWNTDPWSATRDRVNQFYDSILAGDVMSILAEYSTNGQTIGNGRRTGSVTVSSDPSATLADADIQTQLASWLADGTLPASTANSLYCIYLASGVTVQQGNGSSCQTFCGYHDVTPDQVYYAVMPYPDCSGCTGGLQPFDALTSASSHELCEAVTDPVPGQGWYDDQNGEIGDICAWRTRQSGGFTVQLEWSNARGACV